MIRFLENCKLWNRYNFYKSCNTCRRYNFYNSCNTCHRYNFYNSCNTCRNKKYICERLSAMEIHFFFKFLIWCMIIILSPNLTIEKVSHQNQTWAYYIKYKRWEAACVFDILACKYLLNYNNYYYYKWTCSVVNPLASIAMKWQHL